MNTRTHGDGVIAKIEASLSGDRRKGWYVGLYDNEGRFGTLTYVGDAPGDSQSNYSRARELRDDYNARAV